MLQSESVPDTSFADESQQPAAVLRISVVNAARPPAPALRVAVVIATRARPMLLSRCLHALLRQTMAPQTMEILVCDDGPDAATFEVVNALAHERANGPAVRYIVPDKGTRGPAAARNAAWRQARAPIIAFTDDDTVPAEDWLACGLSALEDGVDAVSGQIIMPLPPRPSDYERDAAGLSQAEFATANCFVRRSALEEVGGFDPRFTAAWREDSDLHFALLEAGLNVIRAESARVLHPIRPARFAAGLGMQKKVVFDSLLLRKHPKLYRDRVRKGRPWFYLLVTAMIILAAGAALAGWWPLAGTALGLWVLLTIGFYIRRMRGTSFRLRDRMDLLLTSILIPPLSIGWRLVGMARFGGGLP